MSGEAGAREAGEGVAGAQRPQGAPCWNPQAAPGARARYLPARSHSRPRFLEKPLFRPGQATAGAGSPLRAVFGNDCRVADARGMDVAFLGERALRRSIQLGNDAIRGARTSRHTVADAIPGGAR